MEVSNSYLKELELESQIIKTRIDMILKIIKQFSSEDIEDIFISDFTDSEGKRHYESLWAFSNNFLFEARDFRSKFDIDKVKYTSKLNHIEIISDNYDFEDAGNDSVLTFLFYTNDEMSGVLKASSTNCNVLNKLIHKYFYNIV